MDDYANIINANNTCNHLSQTIKEGKNSVPFDLRLIDEKRPENGLFVQYMGGNKCNDTANYQLLIQINCNSNIDSVTFQLD